ncbi:glycosyltransferase family 2 protein [Erythrobacter ani]|uniref:glycosyltransferase family 2 protein n=1 Tax=Erythrobacter ani TaxID=2827235 RepID=UPI0034E242FC
MSVPQEHRVQDERKWAIAWLRVKVHADALATDPRTYLRAAWWWVLGKRLRARIVLSPLLGRSRSAYRLWLALGRDKLAGNQSVDEHSVSIIALVEDGEGRDRTLQSLASEGIAAELVSSKLPERLGEIFAHDDTWALPMFSGDLLASGAGAVYRQSASAVSGATRLIFADDDILDENGHRSEPHLKPDWNSELFQHFDFLTGAAIVRLNAATFAELAERNWASNLIAHAVRDCESKGAEIVHVRNILHHRVSRPDPRTVPPPNFSDKEPVELPSVSIIIPTRNGLKFLRKCLGGLERTTYPTPLEIIVIDNGSDDPETLQFLADIRPDFARVLRDDGPFNFAALNNRAVAEATGDMLCFLNNDIEILDTDWLMTLAKQALRDDVGAVGACLLYPDGRIQHAGVVMGIGGGAAHAHRLLAPGERGYFGRHSLPQYVTAVTAACLVVEKEKFLAVGGFDADNFAVSFNDVDLCLKLNRRGWQSMYEPRAILVHHESVSRGLDRDAAGAARLGRELEALQNRWNEAVCHSSETAGEQAVDPFHHPLLSAYSEQFVLRL